MVITHYGAECFRLQFGGTTLAFNPISKKSKHKTTRFGADIALVSLNHPDFNGIEQVTRGDKEPLIINGPGEYEAGGITVRGFPTVSEYDKGKSGNRLNTLYVVTIEDMKICFLGALSKNDFGSDIKEALDDIDILFVPIGGEGVLDAKAAHQITVKLEPKIVIPMHYEGIGKKGAIQTFLKEEGEKNGKPEDKLTLKKKDLVGKESQVLVLKAQ